MPTSRPSPTEKARALLLSTVDGVVAHKTIDKLKRLAEGCDEGALAALAEYAEHGSMPHVRDYATSTLAEIVPSPDPTRAVVFERLLAADGPSRRYWAAEGFATSAGKAAFPKLIEIVLNQKEPLSLRGKAVKSLSSASGQPFDRGLSPDPGYWKESELRLDEIRAWAAAGYPRGEGYVKPLEDPALYRPKTDFEKTVAKFNARLANARKDADPAHPSNYLVAADSAVMAKVLATWPLPANYRDFLTRFSPLNVVLETKRFYNGGLALFGAHELIDGQIGYASDNRGTPVRGWPPQYLVIATHGGDPFVLDLAQIRGDDAPVLTADHEESQWQFEPSAVTFKRFLTDLS